MIWLTFETFALMLVSAAIGVGLGGLFAERWARPLADFASVGSPRPWLGEAKPKPAAPTLPTAPALLSDDERTRLAASLAEDRAPAVPEPPVAVVPEPEMPPVATVRVDTPVEPVAPPVAAPPLAESDVARAAEADRHGVRPIGTAGPVGAADDLKRIKGIGRQNEARLNALGIWHFRQIAGWTQSEARWIGSFLAFTGRIEREDWIGQAKRLAAGGETEFSRRVDAGEVPSSSAQG